jgi:hypothetical protein
MKRLQRLGLVMVMALVVTCGVVGSASATTIEPANTAFTLTATNNMWTVGTLPASCTHSTMTGTTPASGGATWTSLSITTMSYSGCSYGVVAVTVTPSDGCHTPATAPKLDLMGVSAATAVGRLTLPVGCNINIGIPLFSCDVVVTGGQTIGNGTAGAGGIDWTNRGGAVKSMVDFNGAVIPTLHFIGGTLACTSIAGPTGTLTGNYSVASATNLTVTP